MGRVRLIKWGPRIIDLDIIFFNDEVLDEENFNCASSTYAFKKNFLVLEAYAWNSSKFEVYPAFRKKTVTMLFK